MFKIAKLNDVKKEKLNITQVIYEMQYYSNGKVNSKESFKTLSFEILGDDYSFSFDLNCKKEKLLKIPMNEQIDFKKYILTNEIWFNVGNLNGVVPDFDVKIIRYLKNKYNVFIKFYIDNSLDNNNYSGVIEFDFNLDDYM